MKVYGKKMSRNLFVCCLFSYSIPVARESRLITLFTSLQDSKSPFKDSTWAETNFCSPELVTRFREKTEAVSEQHGKDLQCQ